MAKMHIKVIPVEDEEDEEPVEVGPPFGSLEWLYTWKETDGLLPTPINVSITGSLKYHVPELKWYNFDVFPHKVKMTNTGYTVVIGAKWKAERPYLEGGPFLEKHVLSQIHFHWGANMFDGSDHSIDNMKYPGEMQVTFFRSEYMTQDEALRYDDGVAIVCYIIKYGVNPDERLQWIIEGFSRIQEARATTRIGPRPICDLLPMFFEDYFMYWGRLKSIKGEQYVVRWIVPRVILYASYEQMAAFRSLWNPFDEPILQNYRPLRERGDRQLFFLSPHYSQHNSLFPIPRIPEPSISVLSPVYINSPELLPLQNAYMIPSNNENEEELAAEKKSTLS